MSCSVELNMKKVITSSQYSKTAFYLVPLVSKSVMVLFSMNWFGTLLPTSVCQ